VTAQHEGRQLPRNDPCRHLALRRRVDHAFVTSATIASRRISPRGVVISGWMREPLSCSPVICCIGPRAQCTHQGTRTGQPSSSQYSHESIGSPALIAAVIIGSSSFGCTRSVISISHYDRARAFSALDEQAKADVDAGPVPCPLRPFRYSGGDSTALGPRPMSGNSTTVMIPAVGHTPSAGSGRRPPWMRVPAVVLLDRDSVQLRYSRSTLLIQVTTRVDDHVDRHQGSLPGRSIVSSLPGGIDSWTHRIVLLRRIV